MIKLHELSNNSLVPLSFLSQQKQPLSISTSQKDNLEGLIKKYNRKPNFTSGKSGLHFLADYYEMFSSHYAFKDDDADKTSLTRGYSKMKRFLELEKNIKSWELFFVIFGDAYPSGEMNCMFLDEIETALERNNRNQGNYFTTSRWANFKAIKDAEYWIEKGRKNTHLPDIGKYVKFLNSVPNDTPVQMYRGFLCRKDLGKQIREINDKRDAGYWTQVEGRGTSYSLDKTIAQSFAIRRTNITDILKLLNGMCEGRPLHEYKHLESVQSYRKRIETLTGRKEVIVEVSRTLGWTATDTGNQYSVDVSKTTPISQIVENIINAGSSWVLDTAKDILENEGKYTDSLPDEYEDTDSYEGYGVRPIVGTYSVLKRDILTVHDKFGEAELTVLPKNAFLERYDFMTTDEISKSSRYVIDDLKKQQELD